MKGLEAKTLGLRKVIRHEYKRIVAFMLTVAMVVTNFGTNLTVAFAAGEEESSLFLLNSSELEDAISAALESGDVFDFSSLELKAKQKSLKTSYEKLIGSKAGKVYQLDVDIDSSYATEHTDLQVFYNAGTDDVVFLFINESDMAVTFRANVSGYETARVTVNPNTTNIEDAEGVENAEDYSGTTMVDDEKKPQAEVVKPEGETSESESASDETEADVTESENASENGEAEETTGAEGTAETETSAAEETEAETEPETEAKAPAAEEAEEEIELTPEEGSASASISAKKVFRVSTSAEAAVEAPAADAEEETEAEEPEKETEAPVETTAEETVADDSTEETIADETQADETTAADETDGELTEETEAPTEDVTAPDETTGEQPAGNGGSENIGFDNDEQFLEDDSIELAGELNGKAYNTVTIWGSANARAYVVKAEDLTGEAAVEGQYSVDYSVDPVGAATIKGAHTVNEGETLYFAVDPQVGYEITEVTANGEPLEEADAADVASASDLEQHEHVYAVEAVTEDLEIVASLEETVGVAHPEFSASYVSSEGVTISLHAEEGILPEGTELSVTEVTDALGDTIKEKMDSEAEGTTVHSVLAYDINLLYNGKKLSNSWSESGYVDVTFTGAPIQEMTEASDKVEIVAVDDTSKTQLSAENAAEAEAGELKLETVSEQNVEDAAVEEVGFKAEHFTIYAVAASSGVMVIANGTLNVAKTSMKVGQTQSITTPSVNDNCNEYEWYSDNTNVVQISNQKKKTAQIKAITAGTATITYKYCVNSSWLWHSHDMSGNNKVTITVTADPITGVTLTGDDTVKAFDSIKLTAKTEPVGSAASSLEWESSNTAILTVDNTGNVTGVAPGTAIVTVHATSSVDAKVYTATKEITVIPATQSTDRALFYYLKTPTSDPKSNETSQWGECIGEGTITVTGGTWVDSGKNMYSPTHRVLTWPDGSTGSTWTIDKNEYDSHWNAIFNAYKASVESKYDGVTLTKDDIQSITLIPYKISRNNSSTPDKHVDCRVRIEVNDFYNAIYYVEDAGETGFQSVQQSGPYRGGDTTEPTATTVAAYPHTKEINGVTYTFVGWYDNDQFTGNVISFPYAMYANKEFYAKYVAGYNVNYDLDGGSWNIPNTYFKNAGSNVYVVGTTPTKTGYDFNGWDRQDDNSHVYVANEKFTMPNNNVTFKARWTPKEVSYTVNYYWAGTTTSVAESKTVTGKHFGDVINDEVPVEAEGYTAINTPQSLTLGSGDNIINFYYYKNVTLRANSNRYTYDGNERSVEGYISSDSGAVFENISVRATGKDAGTYPAKFRDGLVGTVDTTRKYIIQAVENGSLVIDKAQVTLKSADLSKKYDGKALVNGETALKTETGFAKGEGATYTFTGSQTIVGSSANAFSYTLKANTNADNYIINKSEGTLTVTNRDAKYEATVVAKSATVTYDGKEHSAIGVETYEFVVDGNTYTVTGLSTEDPTQKDAGTYTNNITGTPVVLDKDRNDVTSEFTIKTQNGSLTINKAEVILKSADRSKQYDGTALVNGETALETETGFAEGEGATYTFTGSQTLVGSSANAFSYTLKANTKESNYIIKKSEGTLSVTNRGTKYEVTVKANSTTATYDGTDHSATGVETYEFTIGSNKYTVTGLSTQDPTQKDAGTYTNNITGTPVVLDAEGHDVTAQFTVKTENGKLIINKAQVTLKSADLSKKYDGKALVNGETALKTETGFAKGEGATYTFTGSQTIVGSSANAFSYTLKANTNADNYIINKSEGTLTVTDRGTKYTVTVKANSATATYDGIEHSAIGVETYKFVLDGNTYTVTGLSTQDPKQKKAGTYTNNIIGTPVVLDENDNDVTDQFIVKTQNGTLTVDPREITITADEASKYVGEADPEDYISTPGVVTRIMRWIRPAAAFGATVTSGEVVVGDKLAFKVTRPGAGTDEARGTYKDAVTVTETDAAANANYKITWIPADFHIYEDGLEVEKTVKAPTAPKTVFELGDVMEFNIKVTNTGNTDLKDVIVKDELNGATIVANTGEYTVNADGTATIAVLTAGASVDVKATYTVKAADLGNTSFTNKATATAKTENPKNPDGKVTGEDETDPIAIDSRTTGGGNSGGGGGGGSSSGPRDNGGSSSGGPGTTTVTIDPDAVPLANLPNEDGADNLLMIDDEDVPLAALPKTGQSGTNGLVFFLSSMMLAAFVAVTKKREDDK